MPPRPFKKARLSNHAMQQSVELLFLGTSSGGGPSKSRNCSSLALVQHGRTTLVDAADGTFRQILSYGVKASSIDQILVTHMHADHILGLPAVVLQCLPGVANTPEKLKRFECRDPSLKPAVNVYGPSGLRSFLRNAFFSTHIQLGGMYACHELLHPGDSPTSCAVEAMHLNEMAGQDLLVDSEGLWRDILDPSSSSSHRSSSKLQISAGPIEHRVPSLAYTFSYPRTTRPVPSHYTSTLKENGLQPSLLGKMVQTGEPIVLPDGRMLVHPGWEEGPRIAVLGDCNDARGTSSLAQDVDLLVHEATNCYVPKPKDDPADFQTKAEATRIKSAGRGHSTPDVAGSFARSVGARNLVLNHFSTMFYKSSDFKEITRQAKEAFSDGEARHSGGMVVCSRDGMRLAVESGGRVSIVSSDTS